MVGQKSIFAAVLHHYYWMKKNGPSMTATIGIKTSPKIH